MSFRSVMNIAGSAMNAQTVRLNTIASNLANANSAAASAQDAYKARKPVFAAVAERSNMGEPGGAGTAVRVLDVVESPEPARKVHEPDNPLADAEGNVYYSNVNTVEEMTDMMSASRAFESNAEVISRVKSMQAALLKMGEA